MEICIVTLNENAAADSAFLQMLNLMCNLSEYVYEKGEKSGLKRGIKRGVRRGLKRGRKVGREEGREEIKRDVVKAMIEEGYPEASILRIARVTPEEYKKWAAEKPD